MLLYVYKYNFAWILLKGGCSSIGRATVCGTVSSLFKSGLPPCVYKQCIYIYNVNNFYLHNWLVLNKVNNLW